MSKPDVSVVITFFREGEVLRETIESALDQTFPDTEVVLVDNNASPETRQVALDYVARFPKSVRLVHEPIQGVAASKNRGLIESRGEFVAILDGDDLMLPERLSLQREAFRNNPKLALVSTRLDRVSMDNRIEVRKDIQQTEPNIWFETERIVKDLFPASPESGSGETLHFPLISTAFFRRETAIKVGGFNNAFNPRWFEDIEFFIRMYGMGEFYKVPQSLVRYRISSPEAMEVKLKQMDWIGLCRQRDLFYRILWDRFGDDTPKTASVFRKLKALWYRHESFNFFRYRQGTSLGKRMLEHSLRNNPRDLTAWKLWLKSHLPQAIHPKLFWFGELLGDPLPSGATMETVDNLFRTEPVQRGEGR
ncbi:MAG: glycosyltransferase family 2 protein [Leptospirales bacterium]